MVNTTYLWGEQTEKVLRSLQFCVLLSPRKCFIGTSTLILWSFMLLYIWWYRIYWREDYYWISRWIMGLSNLIKKENIPKCKDLYGLLFIYGLPNDRPEAAGKQFFFFFFYPLHHQKNIYWKSLFYS